MQAFLKKIPDEYGPYLDACARIRNMSKTALLGRLIEIIGRDQLVLSILDDDSKPDRQKGAHRYKPKGAEDGMPGSLT
jgi:hypothetical protein